MDQNTSAILSPRQVFKFGGTSVGSPDALRCAMAHVKTAAPSVIVVASAMNGVTDDLLATAKGAATSELAPVLETIARLRTRHEAMLRELVSDQRLRDPVHAAIDASMNELSAICQGLSILRELTPRTLDLVVSRGERLLCKIFTAALNDSGIPAEYVDATEIVVLRPQAGALWPDFARCAAASESRFWPLLNRGVVPVVPGYIGKGPDGNVVTLGRGGTDFSAAILARSLAAAQVVLFKEVDGLMTADPKAVPEARVLPELHFREAAELAYYGAKILHPRTMIPLVPEGIPLYIRNTFRAPGSGPEARGTRIASDLAESRYPVKALTAVPLQALLSIEGNGMMGVPGIAGRAFTALCQAGHSVTMISQASSESSICFVLTASEADHAASTLNACFAEELRARLIEGVRVEFGIALLSVVGLGMRGTPGVAARAFTALAEGRINILAIAQGSSELNITIAIRDGDVSSALNRLHKEFQLDKIRPLSEASGRGATICILGVGQIGRALTTMLSAQVGRSERELGFRLRTVALCDRRDLLVAEDGLDGEALSEVVRRKEAGQRFGEPAPSDLLPKLRERVFSLPARKPVLVDVTAAETAPLLLAAMERGFHVVLANKKPLSGSQEDYDRLFATASERGVQLRYEATVGAGLPVLDTISKLHEVGDEIDVVLGCLSGTLGYLMTELERGVAFSTAVRKAHAMGYTEPDPRDDLSGMDVARKALILARTLGLRLSLADILVEPLFPADLVDPAATPSHFLDKLPALDGDVGRRVAHAKGQSCVLRYMARIERSGKVRVGLEQVSESAPAGRLRGTDNLVVLHSSRYRDNPLVVIGPGAGAEVTASGVLNDILAIARR